MKFVRYIYIALLYCFVLGVGSQEMDAQGRKRRPTKPKTQRSVSATRQSPRGQRATKATQRGKTQRRGKAQPGRAATTKATARSVNFDALRQERRHLDSLRLHNGGTRTLVPPAELPSVEIEPLLARFRRGDTTLRSETIARLYYSHHVKRGTGSFLHQIEQEADASIAASRYAEALRTVRRGLLRSPMHFALIKRACDLAQHEGDPEVDVYLWQLVELFVVVEEGGDGKTPKTAFEVMGPSDALLFETLWMETPKEEIKRRDPVSVEGGKQLLVLEIGTGEKKTLRHYLMPLAY